MDGKKKSMDHLEISNYNVKYFVLYHSILFNFRLLQGLWLDLISASLYFAFHLVQTICIALPLDYLVFALESTLRLFFLNTIYNYGSLAAVYLKKHGYGQWRWLSFFLCQIFLIPISSMLVLKKLQNQMKMSRIWCLTRPT